jgi:hypothetical protein
VSDYPVEELLRGLVAGIVAVGLAIAVTTAGGRRGSGSRLPPAVGLPITVAALAAIGVSRAPTASVVVGLTGVTAAAALAVGWPGGRRVSAVAGLLLTVPFAWLLAVDASSVVWVRAVVTGAATVGPVAAARTDVDLGPTGLTPALYAVSAAGVFAAVPNTEEAAALLGASMPAALAGLPLGRARLGRVGAAGAAALLVWVAADGSLGREPAVVGAVACLGLLATLPAGRWLATYLRFRRRAPRDLMIGRPLPTLVVHATVVGVASRVAGTSSELWVAVPVAIATVVFALLVSAALVVPRGDEPLDRPPQTLLQ